MSYADYYDEMLEIALEFQDFVSEALYASGFPIGCYSSRKWQQDKGESRAGVEIKFDRIFHRSGRLWIETSEKADPANGHYVPSGIYRNDNSWLYVIGDYSAIWILPKNILRLLFESLRYQEIQNNTATSTGFFLPVGDADKYAVKKLLF